VSLSNYFRDMNWWRQCSLCGTLNSLYWLCLQVNFGENGDHCLVKNPMHGPALVQKKIRDWFRSVCEPAWSRTGNRTGSNSNSAFYTSFCRLFPPPKFHILHICHILHFTIINHIDHCTVNNMVKWVTYHVQVYSIEHSMIVDRLKSGPLVGW